MVHYLIRTLKPYLWSDDNPSVGKNAWYEKRHVSPKKNSLPCLHFLQGKEFDYRHTCMSVRVPANRLPDITYNTMVLLSIYAPTWCVILFSQQTCGQELVFTNILWIKCATSCFAFSESGNNPTAVSVFCPLHIGGYFFINRRHNRGPFQVSFLHFLNSSSQPPSIGVLVVY
jgi:hypothetical protein